MNIRIYKVITVAVIAMSSLFSISAFSNTYTDEQMNKYNVWAGAYYCMGIYPTIKELQAFSEKSKMDSEDVKALIDDESSRRVMYSACLQLIAGHNSTVLMAVKSRSNGTKIVARRLSNLVHESMDEINKRDVDGFIKTFDSLRNFYQLELRLKAEALIENFKTKIPVAPNQSLVAEEKEINSLLESFYVNEENPDFEPKSWIQDLADKKINPYIVRVNAVRGSGN